MNNFISFDDKKLKNQLNRIIIKFRLSDISNFFLRKLKFRKRFRFFNYLITKENIKND